MKILLTGASGFLGKHIAAALASAGHDVIAATREHGFDFNQMLDAANWRPHLRGVEAVINSAGIIVETHRQTFRHLHYQAPVALFRACVQAGVTRVIQISALGADASAITPYHKTKQAADDVLRSLPLDWIVLRPSLVYGAGGKSLALFRHMAMSPVIPLLAGGQQWIQPVHISDVVAAVVTSLHASPAQRTIDIVGPEPVTFVNWLQHIRRANGKAEGPTLAIPPALAMAVARLARYIVPLFNPDNLYMLQQGNTADVHDFARLLERMPISIADCEDEAFR